MKTSKEVALTVAGIVALLTTGQTMVHAASNMTADNNQSGAQLTVSVNDMVAASASNNKNNLKFADQNIRVSSNTSVSSDKIADATKSNADKAAEKAAKAAKETAAKEEATEAKKSSEREAAEAEAKEAEKQAAKEAEVAEKAAKEAEAEATVVEVSAPVAAAPKPQAQTAPAGSGSVYDQFIAAGGTPAMWRIIVLPESGGNPNAVSPAGYRGLGQTKEGWGAGSVATQTQGMIGYATSRYGSIEGALQFRMANGWW